MLTNTQQTKREAELNEFMNCSVNDVYGAPQFELANYFNTHRLLQQLHLELSRNDVRGFIGSGRITAGLFTVTACKHTGAFTVTICAGDIDITLLPKATQAEVVTFLTGVKNGGTK